MFYGVEELKKDIAHTRSPLKVALLLRLLWVERYTMPPHRRVHHYAMSAISISRSHPSVRVYKGCFVNSDEACVPKQYFDGFGVT